MAPHIQTVKEKHLWELWSTLKPLRDLTYFFNMKYYHPEKKLGKSIRIDFSVIIFAIGPFSHLLFLPIFPKYSTKMAMVPIG